MLVPLSWLRDFAPFDLAPTALGEVFDSLGMVVEGIAVVGGGLDDVVVARVLKIEPIAGADKIRKVMVDAGGAEPLQIVCGAWNFSEGDSVPLAPVGAVLPGDFEISRRKMKGVVSEGMLCSARELGLGDDAAGLLVLPPSVVPGAPITEALGIEVDVVYDLAIEGNRPDANCVAGVARDAAARLGLPFSIRSPAPLVSPLVSGPGAFDVRVTAPDLCDRFMATVFSGLAVGPSPAWVQRRLSLAGMRPISNVVDASNYVMLELGQPTHAYDLSSLGAAVLGARAARGGEVVVTLDGVSRELGTGTYPDCVITDGDDVAIGIAGIMGGSSSEVHDGTTRVVLEAAHFAPMAIARTSKRIGLRSEASARFERGTDPEGILRSVARFADILRLTCPNLAVEGTPTDWRATAEPLPPIILRVGQVNHVLGVDLTASEIARLLTPIGFEIMPAGDGLLEVTPPSFRPDATTEIDLVEEVARHHGYQNIARTTVRPAQVGRLTDYQKSRRLLRSVLVGAGVSEAITGPLLGPGDHARAGLPEEGIVAVDPLVREESVLRTSMLPGLLRAVAFNADRRNPDVSLFEIGAVWPGTGSSLPDEREVLSVVLAGAGCDARTAMRLLRLIESALHVEGLQVAAGVAPGLHPTRTAAVTVGPGSERGSGPLPLGWVGEVDPDVVAGWGIGSRVGWLSLDVGPLFGARSLAVSAREVSRFPSSDIDLAFVVDNAVPAAAIEATLRSAAGELLERVALFDVYRGAGVPPTARSLAFRLRFVANDRTLTDADVASARASCIAAVGSAHGAVLRG